MICKKKLFFNEKVYIFIKSGIHLTTKVVGFLPFFIVKFAIKVFMVKRYG